MAQDFYRKYKPILGTTYLTKKEKSTFLFKKLMSEINIHKSLSHKNVVHFLHNFEDNLNVYMVMELCHNKVTSIKGRRSTTLSRKSASLQNSKPNSLYCKFWTPCNTSTHRRSSTGTSSWAICFWAKAWPLKSVILAWLQN